MATCNSTPTALAIDRKTASQLNPLISSLWTEDTLSNLARVLDDMGYFMALADSGDNEISTGRMYLLLGTIAAALDYEAGNPRCAAPQKRNPLEQ